MIRVPAELLAVQLFDSESGRKNGKSETEDMRMRKEEYLLAYTVDMVIKVRCKVKKK